MELGNQLPSIEDCVRDNPITPFFAYRPDELQRAVQYFLKNFQGNILYAVKTNPEIHILQGLYELGVTAFDVASIQEVMLVKEQLPDAILYFMHPVKSRRSIRQAYFNYDVRHFSLDTEFELNKILQETNYADDLCLHLRFSIPNTYAEHNLSEKFGVTLQNAATLLEKTGQAADQLGVCFHVGSQCMHPDAYRIAMRMVAEVMKNAPVEVHFFNVGGGFPSVYPGMIPPHLSEYFDAIHQEFSDVAGYQHMQLLAEPGRALVAESTSLIVQVELRKENMLYINDGTYGSLFDAGVPHFIYPVRVLNSPKSDSSNLIPYSFYGPTCDTLDYMKGPFYLPQEVKEGDYIEIGQMGAYGRTMATAFNGFMPEKEIRVVNDEPLMTMYSDDFISKEPLEIIAA